MLGRLGAAGWGVIWLRVDDSECTDIETDDADSWWPGWPEANSTLAEEIISEHKAGQGFWAKKPRQDILAGIGDDPEYCKTYHIYKNFTLELGFNPSSAIHCQDLFNAPKTTKLDQTPLFIWQSRLSKFKFPSQFKWQGLNQILNY